MNENNNPFLTKCPSCNNLFSKRATSCPKCGAIQNKECQICHSQIPIESTKCPACGDPHPFDDSIVQNNLKPSSKKIATEKNKLFPSAGRTLIKRITFTILLFMLSAFLIGVIHTIMPSGILRFIIIIACLFAIINFWFRKIWV